VLKTLPAAGRMRRAGEASGSRVVLVLSGSGAGAEAVPEKMLTVPARIPVGCVTISPIEAGSDAEGSGTIAVIDPLSCGFSADAADLTMGST
jgi:hypothetical protein